MKASEMANEELAECIESARLAPAKYVRGDELNFHREAIREAAARLRNLGEIGEEVGLEAIREKSSQIGNAAKMREALVKAKKAICHHAKYVCQSLSWENSDIQSNCGDILCAHRDLCEAKTAINAALSAPPRNCDLGTAEEQAERHKRWCRKRQIIKDYLGVGCRKCVVEWSQMPYEEGGAK